jgi:hypothetical protein
MVNYVRVAFRMGGRMDIAFYPTVTEGSLSPGAKRPGRVADHSPPASAEAKECVGTVPPLSNTYSWRGA